METIIVIDVGTTHLKSCLLDISGSILRSDNNPTPLVLEDGKTFYDPQKLWILVKGQIDEYVKSLPQKPLGISITGMAETGLIVRKSTREPVSYLIPSFDEDHNTLVTESDAQESRRVFLSTGLRRSYKYGIYKYLHLLEQQAVDREDTIWLSICDYLVFRLTGEFVTDPTFAARTYVYDIVRCRWDKKRLNTLGLHTENFPRVVDSGISVGKYQGIAVALAGHNHVLASYALLAGDKERLCNSVGTMETYIGLMNGPQFLFDSGLQYGPFVDGGFFFIETLPSSGHSIDWFKNALQLGEISYEEMNASLEKLSDTPTGILYYPYLNGMGSPWYQEDSRGVLFGLSYKHTGMDVLKAILEGLQYQAKWLFRLLDKYHEKTPSNLICAGGGTKNKKMMQIKANVLGMDVYVPSVSDASVSGAAALFLSKNISRKQGENLLHNMSRVDCVYHPVQEVTNQYESIFRQQYYQWLIKRT